MAKNGWKLSKVAKIGSTRNNMFVRLGTDYETRNGGYFESITNSAYQFFSETIKNGTDQIRCDSFQMDRTVKS